MNALMKLLAAVPPDVLAAIVELVRSVIASDDPARTAKRHAKMIAAREASRAALRKALR